MSKFAARDAQIVAAYEAAKSVGHVDYNLIGKALEPPLLQKQVKRILQNSGVTLVAAKRGRPPKNRTALSPMIERIGEIVRLYLLHYEIDAKELSSRTAIPVRVIGNIVSGVHNLSLMEAVALSKEMGRPVTDFIQEGE